MNLTTKKKARKGSKPNSEYLDRLMTTKEPWVEIMTIKDFKKRKERVFDAVSYQAAADELMNWLLAPHGWTVDNAPYPIQIGELQLSMKPLPYKIDLEPGWGWLAPPRVLNEYVPCWLSVGNRNVQIGRVFFSGDIRLPILQTTRTVWMSYTFSEVLSLGGGIRAAKGNVLIGGLGLGWLARKVLEKPGVKRVTIVEKCPHVAAFFGKAFEQQYPGRVAVVVDDAFTYATEYGRHYDRILMDVWSEYGNQQDRRWLALKKQFAGSKTKLWQWA